MRTFGFHRDYHGYAGGHGKVFDYFEHVRAHPGFDARIAFTADSLRDASNPWQDPSLEVERWQPERFDALFLAGLDWQALASDERARPVINLVQGLRHGDPGDPRHAFLSRPAIRICVSAAVAEAITASGRVNGPVHVISNAVDLPPAVPRPTRPDELRVFVAGHKQPLITEALTTLLAAETGLEVTAERGWLPRADLLSRFMQADIVVALPLAREGFFLPGLEAMAAGAATIVPDCGGNRDYAEDRRNCLMPAMTATDLRDAICRLRDDLPLRLRLAASGLDTAARHTAGAERAAFHAILDRLDAEWAQCRFAT